MKDAQPIIETATFHLYTDGSVIDRCGGWAFRLFKPENPLKTHYRLIDLVTERSGQIIGDVNSLEAEMIAIIAGLNAVSDPSYIHIYTDSLDTINGFTRNLAWNSLLKSPSIDISNRLRDRAQLHSITWHHIYSHSDEENEWCHVHAKAAAVRALKKSGREKK